MRFLFVLILIYLSSEQNILIDDRFPVLKFRDSYTEAELQLLDFVNGCMFRQNIRKAVVCLGKTCEEYPSQIHLNTKAFKIKTTAISVIKKDDFININTVIIMIIEFNPNLQKLEPGCFRNMQSLTNLSISSNSKLISLEENLFEGLTNLSILHLNKNGFTHVPSATQALSPKYVPALNQLFLNENYFINVFRDDFKTMVGSNLYELQMTLCQIEYIDSKSLNPLRNLGKIRLGQNQFNVNVISELLNEMIHHEIPLNSLSLYDAGFRRKPPMALLEIVAKSNISYLNIGKNTFDNLNENSFPVMPNLRILDLSSCLLLNIADGTFKKMPNLESLFLANNRLPYISKGILLSQLKDLDLSANSGNAVTRSYFTLDDNIFQNMTELRSLKLSCNLITTVTNLTFNGLVNLRYLALRNSSIFEIRVGAFMTLRRLKYLNLENNHVLNLFTAAVFEGLDELETLLLGGCSIFDLPVFPSPFQYLKNLTFLGLDRNMLYEISPTTFPPLSKLFTLDLSQNRLTEWDNRLFSNMSLKELDISQNKIKFFTVSMLEDIQYLEILNVEGNPLTCDCSLYNVAKWLRTNNVSRKYVKHDDYIPQCVRPDTLQQISLLNYIGYLKKHDICEDTPMNKIVLISVLTILVASGLILSILGYVYRTHVRHWMLLARLACRRYLKLKQNKETQSAEYKYDAFVSYSNEDQDFVINLVTMLENYEPFLKLCVYERDFQIGTGISESVLKSVASSKKTLLIISDAFAKSQWCRWEAKLAEHHHLFFRDGDLKGPCGTLLMILLNAVSEINMTPTLKYLLKTRIYLEWDVDPEKQQMFWAKLRKKLSSPTERSCESHIPIKET